MNFLEMSPPQKICSEKKKFLPSVIQFRKCHHVQKKKLLRHTRKSVYVRTRPNWIFFFFYGFKEVYDTTELKLINNKKKAMMIVDNKSKVNPALN